jgi:hypothetical protein
VVAPLSLVLYVGCGMLAAIALAYLVRDALIDDRVLLVAALLELALLVQVVTGIAQGAGRSGNWEKGVFFAYLLSVPLVVPGAVLLAIKEKSRFGMAVVLAAAAVVAVFVARLVQIWGPYA